MSCKLLQKFSFWRFKNSRKFWIEKKAENFRKKK